MLRPVLLLAVCCLLLLDGSHAGSYEHSHGHHDHDHVHGPGHNCNHDAEEQPNFARENARRLPEPPISATAAPRGTKPTLLTAPATIKFHLDFQELDTDVTASTIKSGEDAAAVKTFLTTKLMPGALDFFTAALKVVPASPRVVKLPQECSTEWSGDPEYYPNSGKCGSFQSTMTCGTGQCL